MMMVREQLHSLNALNRCMLLFVMLVVLVFISYGKIHNPRRADDGLEHMVGKTIISDKHSTTRCNPVEACARIDITTIPYIFEHVSPSFARDNGWWDMKRTRDCLARKRILLLGDSTMGEMFHDLAILLSGAAASQDTTVNSIIMDEYVKKATTPQGRNEDREWTYELKNDVYIKFYCCRRNMTIFASDIDTEIHFRYMGHPQLKENYGGIDTFMEKEIRPEILCMVGIDSTCERPDFILLNSGLHDRDVTTSEFKTVLSSFLRLLQKGYRGIFPDYNKTKSINRNKNFPRVLWKSDFLGCQNKAKLQRADIFSLDDAAYEVTKKFHIPYVNVSKVAEYVPRYSQNYGDNMKTKLYTSDCVHYGSISRAKYFKSLGTISMLITQHVLHDVCKLK